MLISCVKLCDTRCYQLVLEEHRGRKRGSLLNIGLSDDYVGRKSRLFVGAVVQRVRVLGNLLIFKSKHPDMSVLNVASGYLCTIP